jgi:hypothetical protein
MRCSRVLPGVLVLQRHAQHVGSDGKSSQLPQEIRLCNNAAPLLEPNDQIHHGDIKPSCTPTISQPRFLEKYIDTVSHELLLSQTTTLKSWKPPLPVPTLVP